MGSDADLPVGIGFDVDFTDGTSSYTPSAASTTGAEWDTATWDVSSWAGTISTSQSWRSVSDIGWCASIRIITSTKLQQVKWHSTDIMFEIGRGL